MKKNKVAYLLHNFPVLSETFIIEEIYALWESAIEILIFSFQATKTELQSKESDKLFKEVIFALNPKNSFQAFVKVASANLFFFFSNPPLYLNYFFKYFFKIGKKEFSQVFYLGYLIKKQRVTHLHAHFAYLGATAAMIISDFLKIPFSFTVHARDVFIPDEFLKQKIEKAKFIIAISNYNKEYLLKNYPGIFAEKVKVIHCGVAIENFMPGAKSTNAEIRILSGGRLVEKKGFTYLLKACRLLLMKGFSFKCTIFGEGPLREKLATEVEEFGLKDLVTLKGAVDHDEVFNFLAESDIFVLPSIIAEDNDRDGIPVVLMEAMASGLAVVSTEVSGISELIHSGEEGILVSQKDEEKLAEAIAGLINDNGLRKRLGVGARRKIEEQFNLSKNVKLIASLYLEAADKVKHRILYVNGTSEIGGAETSLLNLLRHLDRKRFFPLVVLPRNGPLVERLRKIEIEIFIQPLMEFSRKNCLYFLLATIRLAFLIRKKKIHLVHANSIYISEQSLFAAHASGVPCLCHVRDLAPILGAAKLRSAAFKKMDRFIAISEAVKKDLVEKLNIPENKVTRVYNGVDTEEFFPGISGDKFRNEFNFGSKKLIGIIARLSPEKGHETFLKAAAQVIKEYSEVNFIIVGDAKLGSEKFREAMVNLSRRLGLQDNVLFTGFREDLAEVIAALDIVVVPSRAEPFGRVIIEAFACGIPVIATKSGAAPEVISKEAGILVEPNNIIELKQAIIEVLKDPQQAKTMGQEARKLVVERFSIDRHVSAIGELYRKIVSRSPRATGFARACLLAYRRSRWPDRQG